jgi:DNA-binding winged helix-turn-helix (wHTH) protein/TolB-like protein
MDERLNSDETARFGPFVLDRRNEELLRDGRRVPLQPQAMKVLLLLVARAGDIVTRKELQEAVWPEGTFVDFEQGLNWCIRRIRELLEDDAVHPRYIQTLPRRGYRFVAELARAPERRRPFRGAFTPAVTGAILALILSAAPAARTAPVTVCVLPFDNVSRSAAVAPLADLTTEEVITQLGSVDPQRIRVIDRLTAAKFRKTEECIIHIGRQLDAAFVLEGSVQPGGRTTAALYRVEDNTQVWATAIEPHVNGAAPYTQIAEKIARTFSSKSNR